VFDPSARLLALTLPTLLHAVDGMRRGELGWTRNDCATRSHQRHCRWPTQDATPHLLLPQLSRERIT
jgi:hypothetical protein